MDKVLQHWTQPLKRTFFYNGEKNHWIVGPSTQNSRLSSKLVCFNKQIIFNIFRALSPTSKLSEAEAGGRNLAGAAKQGLAGGALLAG
jgi:hypothetical protein